MGELKDILDATQCPKCKQLDATVSKQERDIARIMRVIHMANDELKAYHEQIQKLDACDTPHEMWDEFLKIKQAKL